MAKFKEFLAGFSAEDKEDLSQSENNNSNSNKAMKKIVLNLICAILAIQDITIGEKGDAAITEDQLNSLEKALKEKDDRITELENEGGLARIAHELVLWTSLGRGAQAAETAKADAETKLAKLQKEFDDFKAEAGDVTPHKPASDESHNGPVSAKDMYNEVKNLL